MMDFYFSFENDGKGGPLRTEICFSPERSSKVLKISKNDRLDALIVLLRDDQFLFFL